MSIPAAHQLDLGLLSQLPDDQRDALEDRAGACSSCSSFRGFEGLDTRCAAVGGKRVSLTLDGCKLRKWNAFVPGDAIALPVRAGDDPGGIDRIQKLIHSAQWRRVGEQAGLVRLERRTYTPGITLITPTGDRPEAMQLCIQWMLNQRMEGEHPIQWIVVDDGQMSIERSLFDDLVDRGWSIDLIRREPGEGDPQHTLCANMRVALPEVRHDKILIIEDDDYYSPGYVEMVSGWLEQADLVGAASANLYYLQTRSYQCFQNDRLAGWCKTAFRPSVIPTVWHAATTSEGHALDLRVWRGWHGTKYLPQDDGEQGGYCIGIKGVPGRRGHTWHDHSRLKDDPQHDQLRAWIGDDARHYIALFDHTGRETRPQDRWNGERWLRATGTTPVNTQKKSLDRDEALAVKTLWMYWDRGLSSAPDIVLRCVESWQRHNPDWMINVLDDRSVSDYIDLDRYRRKPIRVQAFSDILRIHLLERHGGVWADATCFCVRPLDDWLDGRQRDGLFLFKYPMPKRLVCSWFLYAEPGNPVARAWKEKTCEYWQGRTGAYPYFWFHKLFEQMTRDNSAVREVFDRLDYDAPIDSREPSNPHYVARYGKEFLNRLDEEYLKGIGKAPLYKLNKNVHVNAAKISSLIEQCLE